MFIYDRFEKLRSSQGIAKSYIAESIIRTPSTIQDWKKGKSEPNDDQIEVVAKILHTTSAYLRGETDDPSIPTSDQYSPEENAVIKKYRALDKHGKKLVDAVLSIESERFESPKKIVELHPDKIIPLFASSFAAGQGEPDFGNPWVGYNVPADSKAEFAIRINGDSMEPFLKDGSVALCVKKAPRDGEVGAFLIDGEYICKQVCQDVLGDVHLFSLNRQRKDMDRHIKRDDVSQRLQCYGTVMMKKVPPLPVD